MIKFTILKHRLNQPTDETTYKEIFKDDLIIVNTDISPFRINIGLHSEWKACLVNKNQRQEDIFDEDKIRNTQLSTQDITDVIIFYSDISVNNEGVVCLCLDKQGRIFSLPENVIYSSFQASVNSDTQPENCSLYQSLYQCCCVEKPIDEVCYYVGLFYDMLLFQDKPVVSSVHSNEELVKVVTTVLEDSSNGYAGECKQYCAKFPVCFEENIHVCDINGDRKRQEQKEASPYDVTDHGKYLTGNFKDAHAHSKEESLIYEEIGDLDTLPHNGAFCEQGNLKERIAYLSDTGCRRALEKTCSNLSRMRIDKKKIIKMPAWMYVSLILFILFLIVGIVLLVITLCGVLENSNTWVQSITSMIIIVESLIAICIFSYLIFVYFKDSLIQVSDYQDTLKETMALPQEYLQWEVGAKHSFDEGVEGQYCYVNVGTEQKYSSLPGFPDARKDAPPSYTSQDHDGFSITFSAVESDNENYEIAPQGNVDLTIASDADNGTTHRSDEEQTKLRKATSDLKNYLHNIPPPSNSVERTSLL